MLNTKSVLYNLPVPTRPPQRWLSKQHFFLTSVDIFKPLQLFLAFQIVVLSALHEAREGGGGIYWYPSNLLSSFSIQWLLFSIRYIFSIAFQLFQFCCYWTSYHSFSLFPNNRLLDATLFSLKFLFAIAFEINIITNKDKNKETIKESYQRKQ